MSILLICLRRIVPLLCLATMVVLGSAANVAAQGMKPDSANAYIMDLSLQWDVDSSKVKCLGEPNVYHVKRGDVVVFRARATSVDNLTWDPDSVSFNKGKPLLATPANKKSSGPFSRGRAFAIRINRGIQKSILPIEYQLKARCDGIGDNPPGIIVDP